MKTHCKIFLFVLLALIVAASLVLAACDSSQFTATFEGGGGTGEAPPSIVAEEGNITLPQNTFERGGYTFAGWSDGTETYPAGSSYTLKGDVTFTAQWNEIATAKLTLNAGNGGTLSQTQFDVESGTPLAQFLVDKAPTPQSGLTFGGWYNGSQPLESSAVMPSEALTLTAKYIAECTLTVHTMDTSGSYTQTQTEQLSGIFGESFSVADKLPKEHFAVDGTRSNRQSTQQLGVNEQFEVWLSRNRYYVDYLPNLPDEDIEDQSHRYYYGTTVTVTQDMFDMPLAYRLLGWQLEPDGDIWKAVGDTFTVEGNTYLYGRWEAGYIDMFGGNDRLFPVTGEEGKLRLVRSGAPEDIFGTYDPQTGVFAFEQISLQGRLSVSGGMRVFYYYHDTLAQTYADLDGSADTLQIASQGKVVYTHNGTAINGSYTIDVDTGYSCFVPDDPESNESFLYDLFENNSTGEVLFRRQHLEEKGIYASSDGCVVELDGLSGLTYHYTNQNAIYAYGNTPVLELYGYYEKQEDFFLAYTRDATNILFELVFTLDRETKVESVEGYDFESYDGVLNRDDGFRGEYGDKWGTVGERLYLDGFGSAEFGETQGTYTLISWLYSYLDEESEQDVIDDYYLVRFVDAAGTIYYFRMDIDYGDYTVERVISADSQPQELESIFGRHQVEDVYVFETHFPDGFVYVFENGEAEMWSYYGMTNTLEPVYVLYSDFVSRVTRLDNGQYLFGSEAGGVLTEGSFVFTESEGKFTQYFADPHVIVTVTEDEFEKIEIDQTTGRAYYTSDGETTEIGYDYILGYADYYAFEFADGFDASGNNTYTYRYFLAVGETRRFVEIGRADALVMANETEGDYTGRIWFADDKVYLGFLLNSGLLRVIGEGTATAVEGATDVFDFVLTQRVSDLSDDDLDGWKNFRYKVQTGTMGDDLRYFVKQEAAPYQFQNFVSDGFGCYTFSDGNRQVTGEISQVINDIDGNVILIYLTSGRNQFIFAVKEGKAVDVTDSGAGLWYEMNDNMLIGTGTYFVFDGLGTVYYYLTSVFGTMTQTVGTCTKTDNWSSDFWEYDVETDGGPFYNGTTPISRVLFGMIEATPDQVTYYSVPVYRRQIPHRVGEFDVRGGGHIQSIGYPDIDATYTDADGNVYVGNMYLGKPNPDLTGAEFLNTTDGATMVHFWVYENGRATNRHFYFRIVNGQLVPHTLTFGSYYYFDGDVTHPEYVLRLEGGGNADIYSGAARIERGVYVREPGIEDAYRYTSGERTFVFRLGYVEEDVCVFYTYNQSEDNFLRCDADWSTLDTDGFGNATYVDGYGRVYQGYTVIFADGFGYFGATGLSFAFSFDGQNKTFSRLDYSEYVGSYFAEDFSAVVFGEASLFVGGNEYYYTVSGTEVSAYPMGGGNKLTLPLPQGNTYTLNNKTYTKWTGGAVTFVNNSFGAELTLSFTPSGASFRTAASLNGNRTNYTVEVSYTAQGISVTLIYFTGSMDTLSESYPITLHFDGTQNTFDVTPIGLEGKFTFESHPQNGLTFDGRRVGHVVVGSGQVSFDLGFATDSKGSALAGSGLYADIVHDENGFDPTYTGRFVAEDGVEYTVRFLLDTEARHVTLLSVTVEHHFDVAQAGTLTVVQLWLDEAGEYENFAKLDIVDAFLPEDEVTTNIFHAAIGDNKVAVARQKLNTTSGVYDSDAYVFNVTFGEDGFVNGAALEGSYLYGEATAPQAAYMVRFLYTEENGVFTVRYLLTFTIGEKLQHGAAFRNDGGNNFTVTLRDGSSYVVSIRRTSGFQLQVSIA